MRKNMFFAVLVVGFVAVALAVPAQGQRGGRGQVQLPAGAGQQMVQSTCGTCHGLNQIAGSAGYDQAGWEERIASMIELPADQLRTISGYLATNFPERSDYPEAVLLEGPAEVTITEWMAPTLGSRPHDPLSTADGRVWWSGQFTDRLGYVNPATGELREFALPEGARPHGLVEDAEGNIWYTGIGANHIGMLDQNTGEVTTYPIPEAAVVPEGARGPHTPIFDQNGTLFFTLQSGMVGRLVPSTGEMHIAASPTEGTYPYGIQVNADNEVWYVDFRGNRLGHVDSETMVITEHELPNPDSRPRRIAITSDNVIWYTDYPRGYLGRFDPATGDVQEWPSPSGPDSLPYGIAAIDNVIWYSESGVRNDTLVRFDPEFQTFQTFLIPSGGGVIRNMMTTDDGNLVLACSAMNRVALVEID
jgi:virginiamycin B lyase